MSKMMEYKGYHATFEYDNDDHIFVGKVHGISDSLNFHGSSVDELEQMFRQSIDNYLEMCSHFGKSPDKEYSGCFNVRTTPEMHKKLSETALEKEETINSIVNLALEKYFKEDYVTKEVIYCTLPYVPNTIYEGNYIKNTQSTIQEGSMTWKQ